MRFSARLLAAGAALSMLAIGGASAQDIPAFKGLSDDQASDLKAIIEAAKEEGSVSYWDTVIQPTTNDELSKAFQDYYGLPGFKINYTLSSTSNLITRVDQELSANKITIDVASIASPPWTLERAAQGDIVEYHSPQYEHYGQIFEAGLGKDGYFAFNGGYIFVPMWNADNLDFEGTSLKDVIGAVDPGRISHGDVAKSSSYLATFIGQRQVMPESFFEDLAKMEPVFILRSEQIASGLVTGEQLMAYSGMPTRAFQYNSKGANLKFMLPEEGVVLLPQNTFILRDSPNPNAAKLWVNFILSEEGQTILAANEALISGRSGFQTPLPEYSPAIDTLKLIKVDWASINTDDLQAARKDWVGIFNP
ncbi:ABC transporter substrate-binding protein [Amorphus coralli]|uniref:ABC transporter substrate-binding protein n=1 Tax=Amorphus coralli TaxID=340680 RepID=UPI0009FF94FB|nr:extracellular solute-binding protein [Amorphus coralli]